MRSDDCPPSPLAQARRGRPCLLAERARQLAQLAEIDALTAELVDAGHPPAKARELALRWIAP
jgi:hypothetical protein